MLSVDEYNRAAFLVPLVHVDFMLLGEDRLLLIKRAKDGEWWVPGGRVEKGESLRAAAERELLEETGISTSVCGLVGVWEKIERECHKVIVAYWGSAFYQEPMLSVEATEYRWVSREQALHLVSHDHPLIALAFRKEGSH